MLITGLPLYLEKPGIREILKKTWNFEQKTWNFKQFSHGL